LIWANEGETIMKDFGLKITRPTRENNILQLLFKKFNTLHYFKHLTNNQTLSCPFSKDDTTIFQSPKANPKISLFVLYDKTFRFFDSKKTSLWVTNYAS